MSGLDGREQGDMGDMSGLDARKQGEMGDMDLGPQGHQRFIHIPSHPRVNTRPLWDLGINTGIPVYSGFIQFIQILSKKSL